MDEGSNTHLFGRLDLALNVALDGSGHVTPSVDDSNRPDSRWSTTRKGRQGQRLGGEMPQDVTRCGMHLRTDFFRGQLHQGTMMTGSRDAVSG